MAKLTDTSAQFVGRYCTFSQIAFTPILALLILGTPLSAFADKAEVTNEDLELRIRTLEKNISTQERQNTKRLKAIKERMERGNDRLSINGFLAAGVVKGEQQFRNGSEEKALIFSEDLSFRTDTLAALQFNYKLDEDVQATLQIVATGYNEFKVEAEWAYIKYQITDQFTVRAGKLRLPFYLNSENLEVGFSYPWVRPPIDFYTQELTSYEGVDVLYRFSTGEWSHLLQLLTGGTSSADFKVTDIYGITTQSDYGPWSFRLSYQRGTLTVIQFPDFSIPKAEYNTASVGYDNGEWFAMGELNELLADTGPTASFVGAYVTAGKRINKFTPHLTYAKRYSTEKNDWPFLRAAYAAQDQASEVFSSTSIILGLRYDITSSMAAKLEYQRVSGFEEDYMGVISTSMLVGGTVDSENAHIDIYSFVFNLVF